MGLVELEKLDRLLISFEPALSIRQLKLLPSRAGYACWRYIAMEGDLHQRCIGVKAQPGTPWLPSSAAHCLLGTAEDQSCYFAGPVFASQSPATANTAYHH